MLAKQKTLSYLCKQKIEVWCNGPALQILVLSVQVRILIPQQMIQRRNDRRGSFKNCWILREGSSPSRITMIIYTKHEREQQLNLPFQPNRQSSSFVTSRLQIRFPQIVQKNQTKFRSAELYSYICPIKNLEYGYKKNETKQQRYC